MQETIFTYDFEKFNETLKNALANDQAIIRDGVAYWKKGLVNTGIIQHIPLKPIDLVTSDNFIKTISSAQSVIQSTIVAAQVISTATIMVGMVIQTQILSQKIEKVQESVLQISHDIKEQNILFYTDKTSQYLGLLQSFKLLLDTRTDLKNVEQLANTILSTSIQIKSQLITFISNILSLINLGKIKNYAHIEIILQFIQQMMEVLPIGMHLEFILSHRMKQNEFSQVLIEDSNNQFSSLFKQYRQYLNKVNNGIKNLTIKQEEVPYFEKIKIPAMELIKSPLIRELLESPATEELIYQS